MVSISIELQRVILRDFRESDRAAFLRYQTDPRYLQLYDYGSGTERPNELFAQFLRWQSELPRQNIQLGIIERASGRLLGYVGLRKADDDVAEFGIELAPTEWGRFRIALDASASLIRYGFEKLALQKIKGDTASGNYRVTKLARFFGAEIVARRPGPAWMQTRGWEEVDWEVTKHRWEQNKLRV